jgi:hypothetical protein
MNRSALAGAALGLAAGVEHGEPIWRYPPKTLAVHLSYHLVYGLSLAGAYEAIAER